MLNKVFGLDFVFISVDQSDISKDFKVDDTMTFMKTIIDITCEAETRV
jgi:hypothetical protein